MVQRVSTNNFACAKWIVDANGVSAGATHSTIAGAIADAVSGETILVKPGTYTENLTLKAGVTITGMPGDGFTPTTSIVGKCLFTAVGEATLSNIFLETNTDYAIEVSGSNSSNLNVLNCFINCTDNTGVLLSSTGGSLLRLMNCLGNITTDGNAIFDKSNGTLHITDCRFGNTSTNTTANTNSAGLISISWTILFSPIAVSGTGSYSLRAMTIQTLLQSTTCLTDTSSADSTITHCQFASGSAPCLTISGSGQSRVHNCLFESSNANTINGTGRIEYGSLQAFDTNNMSISTTTQIPNKTGPRILLDGGCEIISGAGSPNTVVTAPQGSLFLRTDGTTTNDRAYINTDGSTAWTAITTVA